MALHFFIVTVPSLTVDEPVPQFDAVIDIAPKYCVHGAAIIVPVPSFACRLLALLWSTSIAMSASLMSSLMRR
eukprot:5781009-Amphidinium_carterae.1